MSTKNQTLVRFLRHVLVGSCFIYSFLLNFIKIYITSNKNRTFVGLITGSFFQSCVMYGYVVLCL